MLSQPLLLVVENAMLQMYRQAEQCVRCCCCTRCLPRIECLRMSSRICPAIVSVRVDVVIVPSSSALCDPYCKKSQVAQRTTLLLLGLGSWDLPWVSASGYGLTRFYCFLKEYFSKHNPYQNHSTKKNAHPPPPQLCLSIVCWKIALQGLLPHRTLVCPHYLDLLVCGSRLASRVFTRALGHFLTFLISHQPSRVFCWLWFGDKQYLKGRALGSGVWVSARREGRGRGRSACERKVRQREKREKRLASSSSCCGTSAIASGCAKKQRAKGGIL